ncbi:MAG: sulfoxide reductase heme-binding subunit YedZ, partial [Proteobacteria bacterium]|nr:sulfoxide reductase heme-binding subunit YedZ [Pseudomonadota bacterium]
MIRLIVHLALAAPAVILALAWQRQALGVDFQKALIFESGIWTFNLLLVVLALPWAARWAHWPELLRYRRAIGLWTFAYASTHFSFFFSFLLGWDFARLAEEIAERPYVLLGFGAWLVLLALAATSTRATMRRLGRNWKRLHTAVYLALALVAVHYLLMIRSDWAWPVSYAVLALVLLA